MYCIGVADEMLLSCHSLEVDSSAASLLRRPVTYSWSSLAELKPMTTRFPSDVWTPTPLYACTQAVRPTQRDTQLAPFSHVIKENDLAAE
jgi:hypothetical protein